MYHTARLSMRPLCPDDLDPLSEIFTVQANIPHYPSVYTRAEVAAIITRQQHRFELYGGGLFALIERESQCFVGDCGLIFQRVDDRWELEVGYHLQRAYWKRGFATEAARAFRNLAFENYRIERVISLILPYNMSSRAVAERNGLVVAGETVWRGLPHLVYAIDRHAWERRKIEESHDSPRD